MLGYVPAYGKPHIRSRVESSVLTLQALKDLRVEGWESEYSTIDNVLRHLKGKTASSGSVELYADTLSQFCRFTSMDPDQLVSLQPSRIETDIHAFLDSLQERGLSLKTISTRRSYLLLHFRINGFKAEKALDLEVYHVPARYRKLPEYIPSPAEIFKMADAAPSIRIGPLS